MRLIHYLVPSLILISFLDISFSQVNATEDIITIVANVSKIPYDEYINIKYYKVDLHILNMNGSKVCVYNLCNYTRLDPELQIIGEYDDLELQIGEPLQINRTVNQENTRYIVSDTSDFYIAAETFDIIKKNNQTTVLFTAEGEIGDRYFSEGEGRYTIENRSYVVNLR